MKGRLHIKFLLPLMAFLFIADILPAAITCVGSNGYSVGGGKRCLSLIQDLIKQEKRN